MGRGSALGLALAAFAIGCSAPATPLRPSPAELARAGPDSFDVRFTTTRGPFTLRVRRDWSPLGADRVHYLLERRFYDGAWFFRAIAGFVVQFGLPGRPPLDSAWNTRSIPDEPVRASNRRGTVAFARGGPDTRSIQLYVNLVDNPRLDTVGGFGFPPVGEVVAGMLVVDSLYTGYGGTREQRLPGPSQDSIRVAGNAYLAREFPRLDRILEARVERRWQGRR